MQLRPDLVVFSPGIDGRFNLYARKGVSNDAHKLKHLRALVEVKGSRSLARKSDPGLAEVFLADIEKLGRWRDTVDAARHQQGVSSQPPLMVLLGVDIFEM